MAIKFVDLKAQYESIRGEIDGAIASVLNDAAFIGGKRVTTFEREFADYIGCGHCLGCANGTDALEIALQALGIGPGDQVLVPARTWISTAEAVSTVGANPVFVDVDPSFYTVDTSKIEEKITARTRAIIPVHLYGLPAEMDAVMALARKYRLKVIEDCAQAHGATYRGKKIGTFGDAATFSFFPSKNLGALGDAGAAVTNDPDLDRRMRMIANHGRLGKHDHAIEGRNSRLDSLQAAILSVKLRHLDEWTEARRRTADLYRQYLNALEVQLPVAPPYSRHVYHLFVVQVPEREHVQKELTSQGIESGIHYPVALPFLLAYSHLGHGKSAFPVAATQMDRILSLPMFPEMTEAMVSETCQAVTAALSSRTAQAAMSALASVHAGFRPNGRAAINETAPLDVAATS